MAGTNGLAPKCLEGDKGTDGDQRVNAQSSFLKYFFLGATGTDGDQSYPVGGYVHLRG